MTVEAVDYDYLITVALDEEAGYFTSFIHCSEPKQLNNLTFWEVKDPDWAIAGRGALTCAGEMGRRPAEKLAEAGIREFRPKLLVNVGIAGRISQDLRIGDVVVPDSCLDFTEASKIAGSANATDFLHAPRSMRIEGGLPAFCRRHLTAGSQYLERINATLCNRFESTGLLADSGIRIDFRPLSCVPNVGANDEYRQTLQKANRNLSAMDMESGGVIDAATQARVPLLCIRGISDGAGFDKSAQEKTHSDENRRLAMEAAVCVLETSLGLHAEENRPALPAGMSLVRSSDRVPMDWSAAFKAHESMLSLLVRSDTGDLVSGPIAEMAAKLREEAHTGAVVLLGDKGSGKTTLLTFLQQMLANGQSNAAAVLVRLSHLEAWRGNSFDRQRTYGRLDLCLSRILRISEFPDTAIYLLIDGVNRTGNLRIEMVNRILTCTSVRANIRVALSLESRLDLKALHETGAPFDVVERFKLEPMDIEDARVADLIERFGQLERKGRPRQRATAAEIMERMKRKDIRAVDAFFLELFFVTFGDVVYRDEQTLAECYEIYCSRRLRLGGNARGTSIEGVAQLAFEIYISKIGSISSISSQEIALLVSDHPSIANYLVARHVVEVIRQSKRKPETELNERLNFVFPAEINSFAKQMMRADPTLEDEILDIIISRHSELGVLAKSHTAYLAGRVRKENAQRAVDFLRELKVTPFSTPIGDDQRMLRRTTYISLSLLGDSEAQLGYIRLLLTDVDEAAFNRGFHLVYWGDVPFQPDVKMNYRDLGEYPCNRTFARLIDRIRARPQRVPLIELVTLLSLVQVRHVRGSLRSEQKGAALALIAQDYIRGNRDLPDEVLGFVARIEEDLAQEKFELATIVHEWDALPNIERTGWLKRRRDAGPDQSPFWEGRRLESVAEHTLSAVALAMIFLCDPPEGTEHYNRWRVMELLLVHDFAESRVGDQINEQNYRAERAAIYKYAAFSTYGGVANLWKLADGFKEFAEGQTLNARIARDLDRLHFSLRARTYRDGMSREELAGCESAREKISTATVREIDRMLAAYPAPIRFQTPRAKY